MSVLIQQYAPEAPPYQACFCSFPGFNEFDFLFPYLLGFFWLISKSQNQWNEDEKVRRGVEKIISILFHSYWKEAYSFCPSDDRILKVSVWHSTFKSSTMCVKEVPWINMEKKMCILCALSLRQQSNTLSLLSIGSVKDRGRIRKIEIKNTGWCLI